VSSRRARDRGDVTDVLKAAGDGGGHRDGRRHRDGGSHRDGERRRDGGSHRWRYSASPGDIVHRQPVQSGAKDADPQVAIPILEQGADLVAPQAGRIASIVAKGFPSPRRGSRRLRPLARVPIQTAPEWSASTAVTVVSSGPL